MTAIPAVPSTLPATLGALRASGWQSVPVKEELRRNAVRNIENGQPLFEGVMGYEETVMPQLENALLAGHDVVFLGERGQAKTRMIRSLTGLLDEWMPIIAGSEINDDPYNPVSKHARDLVGSMGDDAPVSWVHRSERFGERDGALGPAIGGGVVTHRGARLRERGGTVIVINPVLEVGLQRFGSPAFPIRSLLRGSEIASVYLQPIPGSDAAVFLGIQKALLDQGGIAWDLVQEHSEGWQALIAQLQATSWETICACCGLSREQLERAAACLRASRAAVFAWAMGITHHANGVDNVQAIVNTAVLSGHIGRPGAGTMPIRGHSNVQGFGSMGVSVHLLPQLRQALETLLGQPLSERQGYDTRALIGAADAGQVDTLFCLGGNLYGANPDSTQAARALGRIDTVVYLATKPNTGHFHGLGARQTLLLPVFNRFETPHRTTVESGNNWVRLNEPGSSHLRSGELRSELHVLAELAHRLLGEGQIAWRRLHDSAYVRELIARTVPGYGPMAGIDQSRREFEVEGRILREPRFSTPSGRAQLRPIPLPDLRLPGPEAFGGLASGERGLVLSLITARSYGQHNTVVYQEGDKYRGMPHRHTILMNAQDLQQAGLQPHQRVTVQGEAGRLEGVEIIAGAIRSGAALMFYPEANVLMRPVCDPRSGTPAFKRVPVLVRAAGGAGAPGDSRCAAPVDPAPLGDRSHP